ncbi:translation elongation factor Ts [candidate division KSB1 bacterium]
MSITASQVNSLRQRTGISMMQCKKALEEVDGDEEKAIEVLRKKGAAKASEKSERVTNEGIVITKIDGNKAAIVKLLCETDFVSKNEDFVKIANDAVDVALSDGADVAKASAEQPIKDLFTKLGENMSIEVKVMEGEGIGDYIHSNCKIGTLVNLKSPDAEKARDIAMQVAAMNPLVVSPEDISDESVAKEREIWKHQLEEEGKPAEIMDKIMIGKEKKFREESALMKQAFVKDGDKTVEQYLDSNSVTEFVRFSI